jgi:hypothetical protein
VTVVVAGLAAFSNVASQEEKVATAGEVVRRIRDVVEALEMIAVCAHGVAIA